MKLALRRPIGPDERAKRIVPLAVEEASARGASVVCPEHLLLAIAAAGGAAATALAQSGVGVAAIRQALDAEHARSLAALGISLEAIAAQLEGAFGADAVAIAASRCVCRGFSSETQTALDDALEVAHALGDRHVSPEHLLVALLRQRGRASRLVESVGAHPGELEAQTVAGLRARRAAWPPARRRTRRRPVPRR